MSTTPDKRLMRRAFERAAAGYDQAARLQREVCARLGDRLGVLAASPSRILDAGSGTGFGAEQLCRRFPDTHIVALDIAHAMVRTGRAKWPANSAVCGDIERLPLAAGSIELIWSNLALQWCTGLARALSELHRVLRPGGWLAYSTLGSRTLWELRAAFEGVDAHSHVNGFEEGVRHEALLRDAGFVPQSIERRTVALRYPTLRDVLHDLKAIGAHNVTGGRPQGLTGKAKWRRIEANYETHRSEGALPATYEVIYAIARRED